jgi:ppGpp synthetase/RelA/SpoT-type nucleotidyltranferase
MKKPVPEQGVRMPEKVNKQDVQGTYEDLKPRLDKLAERLKSAIETLLLKAQIEPQSILPRIKEFESFWDKIERKGYEDPFEQTTDLCGIRIVTFFRSEMDKIESIIEREFTIHEIEDKEELQDPDHFGYRDVHYIVSIKEDWLKSPECRGLDLHNLKAEIQVRSILMHVWGELSHKLVYKEKEFVPKELVRNVNQVSAILENLDRQFDDLREMKDKYYEEIWLKLSASPDFWKHTSLNADTLHVFLNRFFPSRRKEDHRLGPFLKELLAVGMTMEDLAKDMEKAEEVVKKTESTSNIQTPYSQIDALRIAMIGTTPKWMKREVERIWEND